ncbi:ABC transporter substrate-binding protein [Leptolyngbya sp. FACHB-261]|uniref:ABC transporter substrate-binding protein n=1 Tax=Leptolyngbya sp. FACHB-261 TaxID=2692806 RepID=UPI0028C41F29|nr:ABC transporter substrate-binding protein [Leptolyngbya sp. FACHB-261]
MFLLSALLIALPALTQRPVVTLNLLIQALETSQWTDIIQDFEAANLGIRLNLVEGPNATDSVENLYTSTFLLGKSPYDLVYMDVVWTPKFAAAGWLQDLSNQVSPQDLADFFPADVEAGRYEGGLYRLPFRTDAAMLFYRTDLLEQVGAQPPNTFADLIATSKKIQATGAAPWGYLWQGRQYEGAAAMFVEVLEGFGGFWVNPDNNEIGLDRPEAIKAVDFLRETITERISPPGVVTYIEDDVWRFFRSGAAGFMRNWPYAVPLANAGDSPIRGKFAIKPMVAAPGGRSGACKGGWGFGISKSSAHPKEAWKAIQYITSAQTQKNFTLKTGYLPSRRPLFTDPQIVEKYSYFPDLLQVADKAVLRPPIAQYAQASDILQRYLSAAFSGRLSSQEAMQRAARETRALVGNFQGVAG